MREISEERLAKFRKQIDTALADGAEPIAAFDADGTLWDMDFGEHFFHHQANHKLVKNLPEKPWDYYWDLHERDTPAAYLWLAQINAGIPLETVRGWAEEAYNAAEPVPFFSGIRSIIDHLHRRDVQVYVVTASIKWAVEPGAKRLGIPFENVIGIQTKIKDGLVTAEQESVITWREGKVTGLMQATNRKAPFLSAGNTMGDLALLDCATHLRIVNAGVDNSHVNFPTEQKLIEIAKKRGWFHHMYRVTE